MVASGRAVPGSPGAGGAFSPDGALLALAGMDDTATLYRTRDLSRLGTVSVGARGAHTLSPTPFDFSPDSRTLVIGDNSGRVRFFDTTSLQPVGAPLQVASHAITELAYSPTGKSVVATSTFEVDGAHLIDVATGQSRSLEPPVPAPIQPAFSPDGRWLLVPSFLGTVTGYPVVDGVPGHGHKIGLPGAHPLAVAFSPDSRTVASGTSQGAIVLFDAGALDTGVLHALGPPISVSQQNFAELVFSPDGRYLATQDGVQNIRLVDLTQRAVFGAALPSTPGQFVDASFSPDSRTLVLGSPTGSLLVDLDVTTWLAQACERAGRDLNSTEIAKYFPVAPQAYACSPGRRPVSP
jgi:WD40 repeat protein